MGSVPVYHKKISYCASATVLDMQLYRLQYTRVQNVKSEQWFNIQMTVTMAGSGEPKKKPEFFTHKP